MRSSGRQRHASDSGLPLPPLFPGFSQQQLEDWLEYFSEHRITQWKIFQHLQGSQWLEGEEVANISGVSSQSQDSGATALHVAATQGQQDLARALLRADADPWARNNKGSSPIHLAISRGQVEVVTILLEHSPDLVDSYNTRNGFYPLHTAALHRSTLCVDLLLRAGANVGRDTEPTDISPSPLTVFHLAAAEYAKQQTRKVRDTRELERRMTNAIDSKRRRRSGISAKSGNCGGPEAEDSPDDCKKLKEDTLAMLQVLLSKMDQGPVTFWEYSKGSLLHVFCSVDFSPGVRSLLAPPFLHPPDPSDKQGLTPLLLALSLGHLTSARELLYHPVTVSHLHPTLKLSALQLLIKRALTITPLHLDVVQQLLEQGADPSLAHESDSPVCMATSHTLDVKLLDKFLPFLDSSTVNAMDSVTGDTVLHFAAANRERGDIVKLLTKGADIMVERRGEKDTRPLLPMEVAVEEGRGTEYFAALMSFGFSKLVVGIREDEDAVCHLLRTHLVGSAKEKERGFLQEILLVLQAPLILQFRLTDHNIDTIIHFRKLDGTSSVFSKTALSWANENNDRSTSLELLRLELKVHESGGQREGLSCLKQHLTSDSLLPWIIETYQDFFPPAPGRWVLASFSVLSELVLVSYLPYLYDFYSDLDLAVQYKRIGEENSSYSNSQLWTCREESLVGDFDETGDFRESFLWAHWITSVVITISGGIYLLTVLLHSNPRFIRNWERRFKTRWSDCRAPSWLVHSCWLVLETLLVLTCKLVWPVVHVVRKVRYRASTRRSGERCRVMESDQAWGIVKTVEHGVEACSQLLLQLWLLTLYLPVLRSWSTTHVLVRSVTGVANFLTFDLYPACFLEKSLGKILLNSLSLSLGAGLTKVTKHGVSPCDRPLRACPVLASYLLQIVARLEAFRLLLLLDSPLGQYKLLVFFSVHFSVILLTRLVFEDLHMKKSPWLPNNMYDTLIKLAKFFLGVASSSIIMVHVHPPDTTKTLFISHTSFFLLILLEHLTLLLLSPFSPGLLLLLLCLWLASLFLHMLHYTWAHPWAAINGPSLSWQPRRQDRLGARGGYRQVAVLELQMNRMGVE